MVEVLSALLAILKPDNISGLFVNSLTINITIWHKSLSCAQKMQLEEFCANSPYFRTAKHEYLDILLLTFKSNQAAMQGLYKAIDSIYKETV